jgi:hypothetical protein
LNGIQEVSGSIPLISTKENLETTTVSRFFFFPQEGSGSFFLTHF